jgi:hypothetical protein
MFGDAHGDGNKPTAASSGAWALRYWKLPPAADYMQIAAAANRTAHLRLLGIAAVIFAGLH